MTTTRQWLDRLRALKLPRPVKVMNVCGGHERTIAVTGLRKALPDTIELVPGPGCPVCVCPEESIYQAIRLALEEDVILVTFGDMLRVPVNVPKSEPRSLEQARAAGGRIVPIASPLEAVEIARANPGRRVVFFAAGFETTTAPVAAMLAEGVPDNLSVLLAARRTWPAVAMLLDSGQPGFDALIAPGHVSTVMGPEEWDFVPDGHGIPAAVGGFTAETLVAALYSVLRQIVEGRCFLDNCYPEVVRPGGNPAAQRQLDQTMEIVDAAWRGIGTIPASGYALRPAPRRPRRLAHLPLPTTTSGAGAPARCRPAATAPGSCSAASIPTSAPSTARPARRGAPSGRAWSPTRAPAASGGAAACASSARRPSRRMAERPGAARRRIRLGAPSVSDIEARRWLLGGRVQGVGFRPFVYRQALRHGLRGRVLNRAGVVEVEAEGPADALRAFGQALLDEAPPLAAALDPVRDGDRPAVASPASRSQRARRRAAPRIHVPPDHFACDDCLGEMRDPRDRRFRYPFTNCTQCGPRYTLIERLPYDRPNTSMRHFPMCPDCAAEYADPANRRFHAEPIACPACGPRLAFHGGDERAFGEAALAAAVARAARRPRRRGQGHRRLSPPLRRGERGGRREAAPAQGAAGQAPRRDVSGRPRRAAPRDGAAARARGGAGRPGAADRARAEAERRVPGACDRTRHGGDRRDAALQPAA